MSTSEILNRAADLIEQRGHWKGWYCGPNGELCARGAIYAAAGHEPKPRGNSDWFGDGLVRDRDVMRAEAFLDDFLGMHAANFNDAFATTPAEVTGALRGAAEAARAEQ